MYQAEISGLSALTDVVTVRGHSDGRRLTIRSSRASIDRAMRG